MRLIALLAVCALLGACTATLRNDDSSFGGNGDRWFTSSIRGVADLDPGDEDSLAARASAALPLDFVDDWVPGAGPLHVGRSITGGQELYTPENLATPLLVPTDRPYAAWAYAGALRTATRLDADAARRHDVELAAELDLGFVGDPALGEATQKFFHSVFNLTDPQGWDNQLETEPGFILAVSARGRDLYAEDVLGTGLAFDSVSRVQGSLGNILTHVGVGETLRVGVDLDRSLDPGLGERARPDEARDATLFWFADIEGRFVLRNIFLDGNTFSSSHDVEREDFVTDLSTGLVWQDGAWRLGYVWSRRSEEFEGQREDQTTGALTLGWTGRR